MVTKTRKPMKKERCYMCRAVYIPRSGNQLYCGPECAAAARKLLRQQRR